jgi:NAD(P)-dependent dehydrogenase (short-subunit alcohol dehydrogenase family)
MLYSVLLSFVFFSHYEEALMEHSIVVITGASQGIGAATAALLAAQGVRVALIARSVERLQRMVADIHLQGGQARYFVGDVADEIFVTESFAKIRAEWGLVDALINCAGLVINTPFAEMQMADWDRMIATNLRGPMLCAQAAFRQMIERGGGTIINISSLAGVKNVEKFPGLSAYVAAKSGMAGLTEALVVEGKPYGIRAMTISPGAVDTPMLREAAPHLKPGMQPRDMAEIIAFFLSDVGKHLNGTNLELFSNA